MMMKEIRNALMTALLLMLCMPLAAQDDDLDLLFSEEIDTEESFACFTVVNANNDSQTWQLGLQGALIRRTSSISHDDWLLSPEMELRAGHCYLLNFTAKCVMEGRPESMAVLLGQGTDVATYSTIIAAERTFSSKEGEHVSLAFTATASGLFRIGFHDVSQASQSQSF